MATVTIAARALKKGKSYVIQYTDPDSGKKRYHKSFRRKDLAQEEANRLRTLLDSGKLPAQDKARKSVAATFGQAVNLCMAEWDRKLKEEELAKSTYAGYLIQIKSLPDEWKLLLLENISSEMIRDYRVIVAENYSNVLANRRLFAIKQVFKAARIAKLISDDPVSDIKYLSEKKHERKKFLTPEQINEMLQVAATLSTRHYLPLAILLSVEHGCSKQEVLDLKWSDIMLDENLITFFRKKNDQARTHQIMSRTRQALLERKKHLDLRRNKRGIKVKDEYVVGHLDGTRMQSIKNGWNRLCEVCGHQGLHFHDNRHTYYTNILLAGGTLKQASVMIGHKDLRMTNRYSNLEGVLQNSAQDLLAKRYATAGND